MLAPCVTKIKPVQWAASVVADWNGPTVSEGEHYAEVFAVGRSGQPAALDKLMNLASDSLQPAVVRASALELMRQYSSERIEKSLLKATRNRNPFSAGYSCGWIEPYASARRSKIYATFIERFRACGPPGGNPFTQPGTII